MRLSILGIACLCAVTVQAQGVGYKRGEHVRVEAADGTPAAPPVQRIVATPGDRIRVERAALYVNDKVVEGLSPELIATIEGWEPQLIPTGHYLVMGRVSRTTVLSEPEA